MFMSLSSALTKSFAWLKAKVHHCLVQESQQQQRSEGLTSSGVLKQRLLPEAKVYFIELSAKQI